MTALSRDDHGHATDGTTGYFGHVPVLLLSCLVVLFFLNIVSRLTVGPLLPVIESEFDLRHAGAGSLYFFLSAGSCMGLTLSGYVAWQLGHRATIAMSGLTLGAALLAITYTPSLVWIRAELLLLGAGAGLYLPSGVAVLTEHTRENAWGRVLAIHELGPNLGYVCAPLLAELFLQFFTWRGVLGAIGLPAIVLNTAFLFSGLGGSARAHRPSWATISHIAANRTFWGAASLFAVSIGVGLGLYTMMPLFLVSDAGMDRVSANLLTGLSRIAGLLSIFLAGVLADRIGQRRTVLLSLAGSGVSALLLGTLRTPWMTPALTVFQAASAASFYPPGFSLVSSVFPPAVRNVAVSMVLILATLVGAGGAPPLIGVLADHVSFSFAFAAAGVVTLAALGLLGFVPSRSAAQTVEEGGSRPDRR
jgi:NNP family nitrate/nitrite transporter-like MFS transporter